MNDSNAKVGYTESNAGRKSVNRLIIMVSLFVCVFAALVEGGGEIITSIKGVPVNPADWGAVAMLIGTLLLGSGGIKAAQALNKPKTIQNAEV